MDTCGVRNAHPHLPAFPSSLILPVLLGTSFTYLFESAQGSSYFFAFPYWKHNYYIETPVTLLLQGLQAKLLQITVLQCSEVKHRFKRWQNSEEDTSGFCHPVTSSTIYTTQRVKFHVTTTQ